MDRNKKLYVAGKALGEASVFAAIGTLVLFVAGGFCNMLLDRRERKERLKNG